MISLRLAAGYLTYCMKVCRKPICQFESTSITLHTQKCPSENLSCDL